MGMISGEDVSKIIALYESNHSVLKTAEVAGMSTVKVRKILITEGLWESETSVRVGTLLNRALSTEEIAERLHISIKNVQAYMPYERGLYGTENASADAVRAERYRSRIKQAASMQVVKRLVLSKEEKETMTMRMVDEKPGKHEIQEKCVPRVLKLHLELDMHRADELEISTLKQYGKMQNGMMREVLVPADITLHALHYVIQRCFGWQNSHLHKFEMPEEDFKKLTQDQFYIWSKLAGVYFRFPTEDYDDVYWDDDYREGQSFRSWLRKKYTGEYRYKGFCEHYLLNQREVLDMFDRWRQITIREYDFEAEKTTKPYKVPLAEASVTQVEYAFADMCCTELLERLPLAQVLSIKKTKKEAVSRIRAEILKQLSALDTQDAVQLYQQQHFRSKKSEQSFLEQYDIPVKPVTDQLRYCYDYGDNWQVLISCDEAYECNERGEWRSETGKVSEVPYKTLEEVQNFYRPVCIGKDGIELLDDVGGIYGFCDMLRTIYGCIPNNDWEQGERERTIGWAEMMGWTGRWIRAERTL